MTPLDRANFSIAPSRAKAPLVPAKARLGWGIAALLVAAHGAAIGFQLADELHLTVACVLIEGLIYAASAWLITSGRMNSRRCGHSHNGRLAANLHLASRPLPFDRHLQIRLGRPRAGGRGQSLSLYTG